MLTLNDYTNRGYTGEEQLDNLSLVDLNGRVYDPTIGRMISADPTVSAPLFSQAFNRFAYVYDSPLVYVDPSGFVGSVGIPDPCQGDPNCIGLVKVTCFEIPSCFSMLIGMFSLTNPNWGKLVFLPVRPPPPKGGPGSGGSPGPSNNPNDNSKQPQQKMLKQQPRPPCDTAGNAPSPQAYAATGANLKAETAIVSESYFRGSPVTNWGLSLELQASTLSQFHHGGPLDAQAYGGSQAYANYAYGDFMSAAGYSLNFSLVGANAYASVEHYPFGTAMSADYPFTPSANITNISNGYDAQVNGTLCSPEH